MNISRMIQSRPAGMAQGRTGSSLQSVLEPESLRDACIDGSRGRSTFGDADVRDDSKDPRLRNSLSKSCDRQTISGGREHDFAANGRVARLRADDQPFSASWA
jgi:hypothetical protein